MTNCRKILQRNCIAAILVHVIRSCLCSSTPLYECETSVQDLLLTSSGYLKSIAPRGENGTMSINASMCLDEVSVVDHATPAIAVSGTLLIAWDDPRLAWNSSDLGGCMKIQVASSEIWIPPLSGIAKTKHENDVIVIVEELAIITEQGRVSLTLTILEVKAYCKSLEEDSLFTFPRRCEFDFTEEANSINNIEYTTSVEIENQTVLAVPGYKLSAGFSSTLLRLHLHPLGPPGTCSICGDISGTTLRNETVPTSLTAWHMYYPDPDQRGWNCQQLEEHIITNAKECSYKRACFMHVCCLGIPSKSESEESIRNNVLDNLHNSIVPPDDSFGSHLLDVSVYIDVTHILGIDIQSNTMELLISLALVWRDERLKWDPLVGGSQQVSYRADLNPEVAEIWVPDLDLLNQVEGAQNLPAASASVFFDGVVWWKRTGVIKVACDLTGIANFPFDKPTCNVDFGGTRDPLVSRVNYTAGNVEFSKWIQEQSGDYQEYQLQTQDTTVTIETQELSGYTNTFVRYQFYFKRARHYYTIMFVSLYLAFTYMSFGMFFLEPQAGERLGYGTAILFVIVAQDITMSEYTPVSQKLLWIYKFSFGSKIFVIMGIIESLVILYLYFHNDLNDIDSTTISEEREELIVGKNDEIEFKSGHGNQFKDKLDEEKNEELLLIQSENSLTVESPVLVVSQLQQENEPKLKNSARTSWKKCIPSYHPKSGDTEFKKRYRKLHLGDRISFLVIFFGYTLFCFVMFLKVL